MGLPRLSTSELTYPLLNVVLMLTPDDDGSDGRTKAETFPARTSVLTFCRDLQNSRDITRIETLPIRAGASYEIALHNGGSQLRERTAYFSGFDSSRDQIVFIDPNNGFEPKSSCGEMHVGYRDAADVLTQLNENSMVSVFHHFRRMSFSDDYAQIRARKAPSPPQSTGTR